MRVTVIGANGMAGHMVAEYLARQRHIVQTVTRRDLDVEDQSQVDHFFTQLAPDADFVINCVGLLVQDSIKAPHKAAMINSWFPQYAAYRLQNRKTKLVHLSTDCVFDGVKGHYHERDIHTEMNAYGRSKSLGEVNNNKDITFRMSIIGPKLKDSKGTGLFNWISTTEEKSIKGWQNAWWNGITTLELAKCIDKYINDPKITGVYHLVNNENYINKYDLLLLINGIFDLRKYITPVNGPKEINKVLIDTRKEMDFQILGYYDMLNELKGFITP